MKLHNSNKKNFFVNKRWYHHKTTTKVRQHTKKTEYIYIILIKSHRSNRLHIREHLSKNVSQAFYIFFPPYFLLFVSVYICTSSHFFLCLTNKNKKKIPRVFFFSASFPCFIPFIIIFHFNIKVSQLNPLINDTRFVSLMVTFVYNLLCNDNDGGQETEVEHHQRFSFSLYFSLYTLTPTHTETCLKNEKNIIKHSVFIHFSE